MLKQPPQKPLSFINLAKVFKLKLFLIPILLGVSALTFAQSAPERAEISHVQLSGSGCDNSEVAVSLSPDYKAFSILFDNYIAEIGDGSLNSHLLDFTKSCQITMTLQIPDGWQMAFRAVDYRGYVTLSSQATAFQRFSILQEGAPIVSMKEAQLQGPMNDDYYVRSEVRPERLTWSPCLSGETQVRLMSQLNVKLNPRSSDRSFTQITLDSADGSLHQDLSVEWRRCSLGRPGRDSGRAENPGRTPNPGRENPGYIIPGPGRGEPTPRVPVRPGRYAGR